MKLMIFLSVALVSVFAQEVQDIQKCDPQQCNPQLTKACDDYILAGQNNAAMCALEQQGTMVNDGCLYDDQACDQTKKAACDTLLKNNPTMLACLNHQTIGTICRKKP